MASDTTTRPIAVATDDCVGFADPAEILTRLTPDDLHPARLAGPHAWHPWGLTAAPPTDRHLRLILSPAARPDSEEQLLARLAGKLARAPWPPAGPLEIRRDRAVLDCRDDDARRARIEIVRSADGQSRPQAEVVTRDGWPILDELAALNDRTRCIDADRPSHRDLADLAAWVEHKMAQTGGTHPLDIPLPQLLNDQARNDPVATDRLRTILSRREITTGHHSRVLNYLAEHVDQHRIQSPSRSR